MNGMNKGICKHCLRTITWGYSPNGKKTPFNSDGINHWITCKPAQKKRAEKQRIEAERKRKEFEQKQPTLFEKGQKI